jgi:hypothetical protein
MSNDVIKERNGENRSTQPDENDHGANDYRGERHTVALLLRHLDLTAGNEATNDPSRSENERRDKRNYG